MIPREQASKYIATFKKSTLREEDFNQFPEPYRKLGLVVACINKDRYNYYSAYDLIDSFENPETVNPWLTPEGMKLGVFLFGEIQAPYLAATWNLLATQPYQSGYARRSFRCKPTLELFFKKISVFKRFLSLSRLGMGGLSLKEQLQYSTYYDRGNSYFLACVLHHRPAFVDEVVTDIIQAEDEIGGISQDIIKGLLLTPSSKNWKLVGDLLLAAQRQEGLRQTILETLDDCGLGALNYMINLILEHDLARFSSVVRAVNVWFGFNWEAPKKATVNRILKIAESLMLDLTKVEEWLASKDHLEIYTALWAIGLTDVDIANQKALNLVYQSENREQKILALYFVSQTERTNHSIVEYFKKELGKDAAIDHWLIINLPEIELDDHTFKRVLEVAQSISAENKEKPVHIFSWHSFQPNAGAFYNFLLKNSSEEQLAYLAEDIDLLPSEVREDYIRKVFPNSYRYYWNKENPPQPNPDFDYEADSWKRKLVHQSIKNRNETVMNTGIQMFYAMPLHDKDIEVAEELMRRKSKTLRSAILRLLVRQPENRFKTTTKNLVVSRNIDQRLAGLELLTLADDEDKYSDFIAEQIHLYKERPKHSKNEQVFLDKFSKNSNTNSFSNGFGAIDYENLSGLYIPQSKFERKTNFFDKLGIVTSAGKSFKLSAFIDAEKIILAINKLITLINEQRNYEYEREGYQGETVTQLLGQGIHDIKQLETPTPLEELHNLPLANIWIEWYKNSQLNDYEMYMAIRFIANANNPYSTYGKLIPFVKQYIPNLEKIAIDHSTRSYYGKNILYLTVLKRLFKAYQDQSNFINFKLDLLEDVIANFPEDCKKTGFKQNDYSILSSNWTIIATQLIGALTEDELENTTLDQLKKYWDLHLYLTAQYLGYPNSVSQIRDVAAEKVKNARDMPSPNIEATLKLHQKNIINDDDLLFQALYSGSLMSIIDGGLNYRVRSGKIPKNPVPEHVFLPLKTNLLQIELERGDIATEASDYVSHIITVKGTHYVFDILQRLGKESFERGYSYYNDSKKSKFSGILRKSVPSESESYEDFVSLANEAKIPKKRLIELACYATQWAGYVGEYLGLEKLEDAVWWFQAHVSDYMSSEKETLISRYSDISKSDFAIGAIDIDWFNKVYKNLGKSNWKLLHDAAKYISDGNGHRQVKLYSSVMLGEVKITETLKKVKEKRDKDYVRALGLIPLSKTVPEKDLLKRYNLLQQFLKESKQFGAQRQESEKLAVEIGLDNLSRNAGYKDRVRFSWAMEAKATQEIMENATLKLDETELKLVINELGKASIQVTKAGKPLKNIPAKYRKEKSVIALKEHKTYLAQQYKRTRLSLENAMVNEDQFTAAEIHKLMLHPIVKAMLSKLVMFSPEKEISGFYSEGTLTNVSGKIHTLTAEDTLVIAHSSHLYQTVEWDVYQKHLFAERIIQPFKQVFRELYVITEEERENSFRSKRYEGHQIQPNKTVALLRSRGWTVNRDEGLQKVYHKRGFMATMYAMADWYSPSDVEAPTLEEVCFHSLTDYQPIPLSEIPPVVFSEIMRDIDLVVSVAHVGGVDPEASHSTVQMRAALAEESARLFKLQNIEVKNRHILIKGKLGEYSIHLGSAQVSKNGLSLSILPVHSQHRGRMFLPFVDDDPKTAELISKMKLLAEDDKIQDPTILAQINN
ncbi:DUF4132 domain-containing protein [Mesonia aestuariivivens]|uniref:DUF4132 domain-containing protein n=1 Tax=Mesonia aestuariivivens TaxID=2796128 RepID=A0ABS6VYB7_9FLAO|nr:DUF4132 domain-containing protein [Mesonia aestuariivivens]MBW2960578.1 DUF4132 domain-containing protein [Mesonia aestuariivivens]